MRLPFIYFSLGIANSVENLAENIDNVSLSPVSVFPMVTIQRITICRLVFANQRIDAIEFVRQQNRCIIVTMITITRTVHCDRMNYAYVELSRRTIA